MEEKLLKLEQIQRSNVYPNKLEDVLADIQKVEEKYSLRPRQFESVVKFSRQCHQVEGVFRQK